MTEGIMEETEAFQSSSMSSSGDDDNDDLAEGQGHSVSSESETDFVEGDSESKQGLANVMAKILGKQVNNESVILCKAKTDRELAQRKRKKEKSKENNIEIVDEKVKKVVSDEDLSSSSDEEDSDPALRKQRLEKKKNWEALGRVKPKILEKEKERTLQKIATRGVVQLFNAVKKQQKHIEEKLTEAGSSERRKEQAIKSMTKGQFLDVLKGTVVNTTLGDIDKKDVKSTLGKAEQRKSEESKPSWSILRDDFMTDAKMKDWDKDSESGESELSGENRQYSDDDMSE